MSVLILYATETGTSQAIADFIALQLRRIHMRARICNVGSYPPSSLINEQFVIFVISTTGSGASPPNMAALWSSLLRSDLPSDLFDETSFAVFGLGDSAYERFCWPAKKLARRMAALGAKEICERGEGDEQHPCGVEGALDVWIDSLLDALIKLYPLDEGAQMIPADALHPPRVTVVDSPKAPAMDSLVLPSVDEINPDTTYHRATVRCNTRITTPDWFQDVRHIEFDFKDDIRYKPGDVALIRPFANPLVVESLLSAIGWSNEADAFIFIQPNCTDQTFPPLPPPTKATTIRALLSHTVDISAIPRRRFFALLAHFATLPIEQEKLGELASGEGADELYEYAQRPRRTIHEVLAEFRSVKIPRDYVLDVFPPLRPRPFSIASFVDKHPRQVHLCVAIVKYRTILRIPRTGVCTSYLAQLKTGDEITVGLQRGLVDLPTDPQMPLICVGPGTGVAPVRAIVENRVMSGAKDTILYFGCRSREKDHHYGEEWRDYEERGELWYRVTFSRDGQEGERRVYVQDVMREEEEGKRIWRLLENGGWVFISGSSNKMPAGVKDSIAWAAQKFGGFGEEESREYLRRLEKEGRIVEECWS